ncbi:hypothetical protein FPOAC2_12698 [Fusarium poae]|jgi:hypothetical protein|uniref:hypothetical protein n=1 Tax=Fusarium poae TaxID=36050 RepID=UPI001CE9A780|nr:hypothetical protein FPOAC1_012363 [Fusarium poae]KAG8667530.1 hypothetical protein FPOAC1_012363 [Fusarium poae]
MSTPTSTPCPKLLRFPREIPSRGIILGQLINSRLNVLPLNSRPIGIKALEPCMLVAYSILKVHPFLADLLNLVAVGGLLGTMLVAESLDAQGDAVALEEIDFPFTHDFG